jgi:hypothetical protein
MLKCSPVREYPQFIPHLSRDFHCRKQEEVKLMLGRSQWPRGLRCGSAAVRLLGMRVRIPPRVWMSVSCECCQVEVSATDWSLVQRSPTECGVSECDRETSKNEEAQAPKGLSNHRKKKLMLR